MDFLGSPLDTRTEDKPNRIEKYEVKPVSERIANSQEVEKIFATMVVKFYKYVNDKMK
jgi:hypothetical protein